MHEGITAVPGVRVGHAQRIGGGWLTGVTVVLPPEGGAVTGVDVRGGGPGTRETDALDPRNLVGRADAVVLAGGSAFGLSSADGVMAWLDGQHRGFPVGPAAEQVVPVVPAAVVFDLGRGGDWRARPNAALGRAAVEAAAGSGSADGPGQAGNVAATGAAATPTAPAAVPHVPHVADVADVTDQAVVPVATAVGDAEGNCGAGAGAVVGGLKGGVGTAAVRLDSGVTVGALVVANASGSVRDPATGALYGSPERVPSAEAHTTAEQRLDAARRESARRAPHNLAPPLNTTLAVVATDAELSGAQAQKLAGTAHDGLARSVRPVHLLTDGDTVFSLATGDRRLPAGVSPALAVNEVLAAGADVVSRAVVRAVLAAESVETPGGVFPAYRELYG